MRLRSSQPTPTMALGALIVLLLVSKPGAGLAQTLDELEHPLVTPRQVAFSADYVNFWTETTVAELGSPTYTDYHPYYLALPRARIGLRHDLQLAIDATYQFPISYDLFPRSEQRLRSEMWIRSLLSEISFRPTPGLAVVAAYLSGRAGSERHESLPDRTARATYGTDLVRLAGTWLPAPASVVGMVTRDLDGLEHPLLRRRRSRLDGEIVWRRYRSSSDEPAISAARFATDTRSTDTRVAFSAAHGITGQLQVAAHAYWQPPFDVNEFVRTERQGLGPLPSTDTRDVSGRFHGVFGTRVNAKWRPHPRAEAFAEVALERHELARFASNFSLDARRVSARATWLTRGSDTGRPLASDLTGLHHPLLDRRQIRIDGRLDYRATDGGSFERPYWRYVAAATGGLTSRIQASAAAGVLHAGTIARVVTPVLSIAAAVRSGQRVELLASWNYHPAAFLDRYPQFILRRFDSFGYHHDFYDDNIEDDMNLRLGIRVLF